MPDSLLKIHKLSISYKSDHGLHRAVNDISFSLKGGESLALVGESGCGKTTTAMAIMGLLGENSQLQGKIKFKDKEITKMSKRQINSIRGNKVAMIFQNPMSSLNPFLKIKTQLVEQIRCHTKRTKAEAIQHAIELLEQVGIPDPENRIECYPHEFSGGMRQRVMIAMALSCDPDLLIADEPTTALDVTIQAQILQQIKDLLKSRNLALLMISHDLGIVANICDRVAVMYEGKIVEQQTVDELFENPHHNYTKKLLAAVPVMESKASALIEPSPLLEVDELTVDYQLDDGESFRAVDNISFTLNDGEILGIAGESGCGKSTTLRAMSGLIPASDGNVLFDEMDLLNLNNETLQASRSKVQMIFQDPYNSLNPRWRIKKIIAEPLLNMTNLSRSEINQKIDELMKLTGISPNLANRFPHELSGGQCQRVGIARALAVEPQILLCDEPVSALDVVIQDQILQLLKELQKKFNLSVVFVSHDLAVVSELCSRVIIMQKGKIVEQGDSQDIFTKPVQNYTKKLISSVPIPDPKRKILT